MKSYYIGVDIGSLTVKVVLIDEEKRILGQATARAGYRGRDMAASLQQQLLVQSDLSMADVHTVIATGYGRVTYPADREVSEITCQAKGIAYLFPNARTVIDIGGQDSKVMKLLPNGKVADFAMNDKCAAGTGRFLEVMASALEVGLDEIGQLALTSERPVNISSFCTVFAESEVISQVSAGAARQDILAGVCESVASRVTSLTRRTGLDPEIVFTGGVARNQGVVNALAKNLGHSLSIPVEPVVTAALGAALIARDINNNC